MYECSTNNLKSYLQSLENDLENDVDVCIKMFCNFFLNACSMMKKSFNKPNFFKHDKYNSNTYFDKECFEQKLILRKCFRKYRRNKSNENKNAYTECRKKYKSFISHLSKIKRSLLTNSRFNLF